MSDVVTVVNVVFAGLGGQGVIKASDILADAAFRAGRDVKKAEVHGMSQRGGSVTSDVRFGREVLSPMVPRGEADFLVVLAASEIAVTRPLLGRARRALPARPRPGGVAPEPEEPQRGPARRAVRVTSTCPRSTGSPRSGRRCPSGCTR